MLQVNSHALAEMQGVGGIQTEELLRIPKEISNIFAVEKPAGTHKIDLVLRLRTASPKDLEKRKNEPLRGI